MKRSIFLIILIATVISLEEDEYTATIKFVSDSVDAIGDGLSITGTTVSIEKEGSYLVTGLNTEGNIIIKASNVEVYLQNLLLESSTTAPITVNSKLKGIKIIALENASLKDNEDETSTGECAVIKIKKKSEVTFRNENSFTLTGSCKNVIKGGSETSVIFDSSNGIYHIEAENNGIASDGYLEFNGGIFNINTKSGDAVKSSPDDTDTDSLGTILINDGSFTVNSYSDAFQAKKNITIVKGNFEIKTENGYDSTTFDSDTQSAKGFKVSSNETGSEIYVHYAEMILNTADDAFHSNGNLTFISGKVQIHSKDDGLHAGYDLVLGKEDAPLEDLFVNILYSYEALEGMTVSIYSGKINLTATDDGINAATGGSNSEDFGPGPSGDGDGGSRPGQSDNNRTRPGQSDDERTGPGGQSDGNRTRPGQFDGNDTRPGPQGGDGGQGHGPGGMSSGNASYFISIHGGEINVFCDGDGIDSNGNIFFEGGVISVFSQGNRDNEPIDHEGNFTLFNADVLCAGSQWMEQIHAGILNGNMMYAYYAQSVTKDKTIKVVDENGEVVREGRITKDVNYIFYSSPNLNENYKFYLIDDNNSETQYTFTFGTPSSDTSGKQDGNSKSENGKKEDNADDKNESNSSSQFLMTTIISIFLLFTLF